MISVADLVRQTAERLRREGGIEAALDKVAETAQAEADLAEAAKITRRLLRDRIGALEDARAELWELTKKVGHLTAILPFTREGWLRERERLRSLARTNPTAAVAAWLQYWYRTAGSHRLDALGWLVEEAPLPEGAEQLGERGALAARALGERNWHLAAPMLSAGATRIRVEDGEVPEPEVQVLLQLLLARLALTAGRLHEAEDVLRMAESRETTAAVLALQARRHRLANDHEKAQSLLVEANNSNPGDLDVVVELIGKAREGNQVDTALEAARVGVDALASLLDVDSDLGRLLEPPAELWVAVADRAGREGMSELTDRALEEAEKLAISEELSAIIAERKAEALPPGEARLGALLLAGGRRLAAGHIEQARADFEKALGEEGDGAEERRLRASAAIRFADSVAVLASVQPLRLVGDEVADALERLVEARAVDGLATSESWNYLIEVDLRLNLARAANVGRADQIWRAFLAAARAVALSPTEARRWSSLAGAAQSLCCYKTAELFARRAWELGGEAEVATQVQALGNAGRIDEAIESLGGATDPWSECVRSYLLLRQGKSEEAVRLLRAVTLDPSWTWAQQTLLSALLLTGRFKQAVAESEAFARIIADRTDEYEFLGMLAQFEEFQGRFDRAAELAAQMLEVEDGFGDGQAASILGEALLLRGERDRGIELLGRGVSAYGSRSVEDWAQVQRPQLEELARGYGIELGDLGALEPLVARRRQQLQELSDPLVELAKASAATADPSVVASARALGRALLYLARAEETQNVDEALAEVSASSIETEVASLRGHVRDLADQQRRESMASEALELSSTGDRAGASALLARLIDEVPYQVDDLLRKLATEDQLRRIADVLADLVKDPQYELSASNVLGWLGMGEPAADDASYPAGALQLQLPNSWFEDHPDPVNDHELFLRYLPELRLRLTWELPPVRVSVDDALEPDGYRLMAEGELLKEGRVDPSARYCSDAAVAFLPAELRPLAKQDPTPGLRRIPAEPILDEGGLAELLTMPAVEVVARLVGDAAKGLAAERRAVGA